MRLTLVFTLTLLWPFVFGAIVWDGRLPLNFTGMELDTSFGPYRTTVKGARPASIYTQLLGRSLSPTPLWNVRLFEEQVYPAVGIEQAFRVLIGSSSIVTARDGRPQSGFRRTGLVAQAAPGFLALSKEKLAFHFSVLLDEWQDLDYVHEHHLVFAEAGDGKHVFRLQIGSPFQNPPGPLPAPRANWLKVLNYGGEIIFETEFKDEMWHNFAVVVDEERGTLQVFYSQNYQVLVSVSRAVPNQIDEGAEMGEIHVGILKLPLLSVQDPPEAWNDVEHYGLQPPTVHGLMYSGIFIETVDDSLSVGNNKTFVIP